MKVKWQSPDQVGLVVSDVMGKSSRGMLDALVADVRDVGVMAAMAHTPLNALEPVKATSTVKPASPS